MLNPRQRAVLAALGRGPVEPGRLGERLELPGAAVVSHIDTLREHGFGIERGPDGFVMTSIPDYGYGVQAGLEAPFVVEYHRSIESTNERARELAEAGETDVLVLADEQTGGRGRRGRRWDSPSGGIYGSLLLRPAEPPDRLPLLTLAAAIAAIEGAAAVGVEAVAKWPNDVLATSGGKLAGVLAQSATADGYVDWVVIGIGLNANVEPTQLPAGSASLQAIAGRQIDRRVVTQTLLESFDAWRRSLDAVVDAWRDHSVTLGREVWIRTAAEELVGTAMDIDDKGALLVETDEGPRRVTAGDCEHLRPTDAGG